MFKVNNTLSITKVFMNKNPEKSQEMRAQTLKMKIDQIWTTGAERTREITRLAKELEENRGRASQGEEVILFQPHRPQREITITELEDPKLAIDESLKASVAKEE